MKDLIKKNPLAVLDENWNEWNDVIKGDNEDE
jgi:hypothetical protein